MAIELGAESIARWDKGIARGGLAEEPSGAERSRPRFAHPAERLLADLLSFYRVRWEYEPTSFVLRRTESGEVAESFTPDFYLPDHDQYLELTTMRQPLVTRKNGKIRRLREGYPGVRIKTLYRRDYERIVETSEPRIAAEHGAIVFSERDIQVRTGELAEEITSALPIDASGRSPFMLLAVGAEVEPFQRALAERLAGLGLAVDLATLEMPRFDPAGPRGPVEATLPVDISLRGRMALLVTGAVSTGLSLDFARRLAAADEPRWLETASLLDRTPARVVDARVRFCGFVAPSECLSGFGLALTPGGDWCSSIVRASGRNATRRTPAG